VTNPRKEGQPPPKVDDEPGPPTVQRPIQSGFTGVPCLPEFPSPAPGLCNHVTAAKKAISRPVHLVRDAKSRALRHSVVRASASD
jgi:hypothetical protein